MDGPIEMRQYFRVSPDVRIESNRNYQDLTENIGKLRGKPLDMFKKLLSYSEKAAGLWKIDPDDVLLLLRVIEGKPHLIVRNEITDEERSVAAPK